MVCVSVCVLVTTISHANAAEPIECRPDMRGSASPPVLRGLQSRQTVINNKNNNRKMLNLRGGNREDKGIVWHYLIHSPPTFFLATGSHFACHCRKLTVLSQTPVLNLIGKEKKRRE